MPKPRIYLETTIFNRYFEPERDNHTATRLLFDEIAAGKFETYSSAYAITELAKTEGPKRADMLAMFDRYPIAILEESVEIKTLADAYVTFGIITERHYYDRLHIACASVNGLDTIISLNFEHINRKKTKTLLGSVNKLFGYNDVYIGTPMEVTENEE
ncbi:MAG: hypothetical protein FWD16_06090 [Clostridia bacterium]|nr:hypothetical protein [Clostridia bacterium]